MPRSRCTQTQIHFTEISYTKLLTLPAGITEINAANAWFAGVYLPAHNARFAKPAALPERAFVAVADQAVLAEILCVQEERVVGRDNTVRFAGLTLPLSESPLRHHYVKARMRVHCYPNSALALFHGPRLIARYTAEGALVPSRPSMTPCSPPSRRGLTSEERAATKQRRPALTAAARGVGATAQVGTKKRSFGRTKKLTGSMLGSAVAL